MKKYLLIACSLMLLFAAGCSNGQKIRVTQQRMARPSSAESEVFAEVEEVVQEDTGALCVISDIGLEGKTVTLMDVNSGRQRTYRYDSHTLFLDKYGDTKSIESFEKGYPVIATAKKDVATLESMQISSEAFIYDDVVKFNIDQSKNIISIADEDFYYDKVLGCYCDDSRVMLSKIKSGDELRVVGLDKRILSIVVTSGHGTLKLENTELFEGSVMCVGLEILAKVEPDMRMELAEGKYLITVANDGWGSSREVLIERNKELVLDLDTMKGEGPKFCKLTFDIKGIDEAVIEIDGEEIDFSIPQEVRYGTHALKITADGYDTIEKNLVVNSEEATIELELATEEDNSLASNDNNNNNNGNNSNNSNNGNNGNNNTNNGTNGGTTDGTTPNDGSSGGGTAEDIIEETVRNEEGESSATSQQDYLTTLYNLLMALYNSQNAGN